MARPKKGLNKPRKNQPRPRPKTPGQGPTNYGRTLQPHAYVGVVLADLPIAYWRLQADPRDQFALDYGPYQQHLRIMNKDKGLTQTTTAIAGSTALTFPATINCWLGGSIKFPATTSLTVVSVEGWIKTSMAADANGQFWFHAQDPGTGNNSITAGHILNTTPRLRLTWSNTTADHVVTTAFADGNWHHVVHTYSSVTDVATLYLDGVVISALSLVSGTQGTGQGAFNVVLGHEVDAVLTQAGAGFAANQAWNGSMHDIAVYSYELSAQQVETHYRTALLPAPRQFT